MGDACLRGELRKAYELAEQLLRRAQGTDDPALLMYAHTLWDLPRLMGEFLLAREHLEMTISLYDPERHGRSPSSMGLMPG